MRGDFVQVVIHQLANFRRLALYHRFQPHRRDSRPGSESLHAAIITAAAFGPVKVHSDMPQLSGGAALVQDELIVHHHPTADARAYGKAEHAVHTLARAKSPFAVGNRAHIVHDVDGYLQVVLQQRFDWHVNPMPGQVGDKAGKPFFDIQPAGGGEAHPAYLGPLKTLFGHHFGNQVRDAADNRLVPEIRERFRVPGRNDLTSGQIHQPGFDIRAA